MKLLYVVLIFLFAGIFYGQTYSYDAISYDDPVYLEQNIIVQSGFTPQGVVQSLFHVNELNLWQPLTIASHALDIYLFGTKNYGAFHLVNVFFHLCNAVLLFVLLRRLKLGDYWAFGIALFWLFHPMRVESVAWISERKDVLSGFLLLISTICWVDGLSRKKPKCFVVSWAAFILACMAKPSVVCLPILLLAIQWYLSASTKCTWKSDLLRIVPFGAVSIAVSGITYFMHLSGGLSDAGGTEYALVPLSFVFYLTETFVPAGPRLWRYPPDEVSLLMVLSFLMILILGVVSYKCRRDRLFLLGLAWYILMWLPISGVVNIGTYFIADRYSYLSQIGVLLMCVALMQPLAIRFKKGVALVTAVAFICCVSISQSYLSVWKSSLTLFSYEVENNPRSLLAPIHLGNEWMKKGDYDRAMSLYRKAVEIDEGSGLAYTNMGLLSELLKDDVGAMKYYKTAVAVHLNRPTPYFRIAHLYEKNGKNEEAYNSLTKAVEEFGSSAEAYAYLGFADLRLRENIPAARKSFAKALALEPYNELARKGMGLLN